MVHRRAVNGEAQPGSDIALPVGWQSIEKVM
jgi:hypothetical protein